MEQSRESKGTELWRHRRRRHTDQRPSNSRNVSPASSMRRAAFAIASGVVVVGVPESVGFWYGVPPALGSQFACAAGGGPMGSRFSPRSVVEQRLDNGLGPALLIREDLLDGLHQALAAPT